VTEVARIDKAQVLAALRERLERDFAAAVEAQRRTRGGATHEESRPENDKDTRALESSYLARGQARRVLELGGALASVSALELRRFEDAGPIAMTALIGLDDGERRSFYFMAPAGGGLEVEVGAVTIRVLTPEAPLGRVLLGQGVGSDVEVRTPQGTREYRVFSLR
jgi:hypothetical protein